MRIDDLEKEKNHAGFRHDHTSVAKYNLEIKNLKEELKINYIPIYESEIESLKKEILGIVIDYYKKGNTIADIVKIENIQKSICDKWFSLSDFGRNTGYLFVEIINEDKFNWRYSNPISEVSFKSLTLQDLI